MGYTRSIKDSVKRMLYAKSGNVCAMYGCKNKLIYENSTNISEICHINAVNDNGARYRTDLLDEYINSYDNLILLCPTHHSIIDKKENEGAYPVDFLKNMKAYHEQQVMDALLNQTAIEPPINWEYYSVDSIIESYDTVFEKEINAESIYKTLDLVLTMKDAVRSIVYGSALICSQNKTDIVDMARLFQIVNMDEYSFVETVSILDNQKVIEEVSIIDPLAGYEDSEGNYHLVQNNYFYKIQNGTWKLRKRGRIFLIICSLMPNNFDFYDFVVNKNIEKLRNI